MSRWRRSVELLRQQMVQNQVLTAGVWIGGLGSLGGGLYVAGCQLADFGSRALFSSVAVRNKEDAFYWVTDWVAENSSSFITSNRLQLRVAPSGVRSAWDVDSPFDPTSHGSMQYEPGLGAHVFMYKRRLMFMRREAQETITAGFDRQPFTPEVIRLWCLGGGETLREFLDEARLAARSKEAGKTSYFAPEGAVWRRIAVRDSRPWESLVLRDELSGTILEDAKAFLGSAERYRLLGVPYRRGYLLHGPPGCGKSSLVSALAGALGLHVGSLSLNTRGLDDVGLAALLRESPPKAIILLEDVDSIFRNRGVGEGANQAEVFLTFSGLLNAIDGVASQEGRMLIMTTNHVDRLDPALLRPGRCDLKLPLAHADEAQAGRMLARFLPSATDDERRRFAAAAGAGGTSMAAIQSHLLKHDTVASCLAHLDELETDDAMAADAAPAGTTAALLRMLGMKEHFWGLYERGARYAHQVPSALQHWDSDEGSTRSVGTAPGLEGTPGIPVPDQNVLMDALVGARPASVAQLKEVMRTHRAWPAEAVDAIAHAAAGRLTSDAFAAWCLRQPSATAAHRDIQEYCEDPVAVPPDSWRGVPDWAVCRAVAAAAGVPAEPRCEALLEAGGVTTRADMERFLQDTVAA